MERMSETHDRLLAEAVQAHEEYERGVAELKSKRAQAFRAAFLGPVSGREIAAATGLSESYVGRIAKGER